MHAASPNPNMDHYSIRTAPDPTYRATDESVVPRPPPPRRPFTNEGPVAAGARAMLRVYVVLTAANEKGSNTVSATRPG